MKRIYTFGHEQVERNITVGDIISNKNNNIKMTQVTAANLEEASIVAEQNIDMIITGVTGMKMLEKVHRIHLLQLRYLLEDLLPTKKF